MCTVGCRKDEADVGTIRNILQVGDSLKRVDFWRERRSMICKIGIESAGLARKELRVVVYLQLYIHSRV